MTNGISSNQAWQFVGKHQQHINTAVIVLLVIYLISLLADITWRFIPQPNTAEQQQTASNTPTNTNTPASNRVNLNQLKQLHLFGNPAVKPAKPVAPVVTDAPQTRLNLKLTGLVSTTEAEFGAAIVEYQGNQATYGIGDKIEGTNVIVKEVFFDRIIIRNGVTMETLMLDGVDFTRMAESQRVSAANKSTKPPSIRSTQTRPARNNPVPVEHLKQLRNKPEDFMDYLTVTPIQSNGELQGYRVNPGKNKALFLGAGLQPNDLITEINGFDLTNQREVLEAMKVLKSEQNMQLRIMRNGVEEELFIELPEENKE